MFYKCAVAENLHTPTTERLKILKGWEGAKAQEIPGGGEMDSLKLVSR